MKCIRIVIHGKVQGVFFRHYCVAEALRLHLSGQVKNLADGTVEVIACGVDNSLLQLAEWCKIGSPRSKVQQVLSYDHPFESFTGFHVIKS